MALKKISIVSFAVLSFVLLCGCTKNKQAIQLKKTMDDKEDQITSMLIGEKGMESAKLNYLIKREYDSALLIIDQQETAFNVILKDLKNVNVEGIKKGKEFQQAEIHYYTALRNLYLFSKKEVEQQKKIEQEKNENKFSIAIDERYKLALDKQRLYQFVYEADDKRNRMKKQFEVENSL
ncbi:MULTISPECIES: hypothetical protein [unclassified Sphingobacterium]|uniref:hypothetical protein n=1 Tax=unclassified Sphingobacterium TaxID=2609468 RepID=UPI0025F2DCB8|nr:MULTISPECIES: hypothetical protein [unclassified Sphingobacterium]